jgi:hypothetical protein
MALAGAGGAADGGEENNVPPQPRRRRTGDAAVVAIATGEDSGRRTPLLLDLMHPLVSVVIVWGVPWQISTFLLSPPNEWHY